MLYRGKVYRPPSESSSLILQLTVGCPHNSCRFCSMYKEKDFDIRSVDEIKRHVLKAREFHPRTVRIVFLADGNSIIMKTDELLEVLNFVTENFPGLERITTYGSAQFVNLKSAEELKKLREAGLSRIHTGMESGSADVLERINKGTDPADIVEAGLKCIEAGLELSEYYLVGAGGRALSELHARESARVLNRIDPDFIRFRTFMPVPGTELHQDYEDGEFELLSPHQALQEMKILLENLAGISSEVLSDHISNYRDIKGSMPEDRDSMMAEVDKALKVDEDKFRDPARVNL